MSVGGALRPDRILSANGRQQEVNTSTVAVSIATLYLLGAVLFAVFAFRNFMVVEVLTIIFLYAALPLGLIIFGASPRGGGGFRASVGLGIKASLGATFLLVSQWLTFARGDKYVSNFPNHKIDAGGGFFQDTAFHVAIINGYINHGHATLGQHLEQPISYHTLSHRVDSIALLLLGVDPWESYALFFFAKGVAFCLAILYFSSKVASRYPSHYFWVLFLGMVPVFHATFYSIGSHGQWVPMLVLLLTAPTVYGIVRKNQWTLAHFLFLSGVVVVMSLGKVSLGFAFAVFLGAWMFFTRPKAVGVYVMGVAWVTFFFLYATSNFGAGASGSFSERLSRVWPEIYTLILLFLLLLILGLLVKERGRFSAGLAVTTLIATLVVVAYAFVETPMDSFYFFHGGVYAVIALVSPLILEHFAGVERGDRLQERDKGLSLLAFGACIFLAIFPLMQKSFYPPFRSIPEITQVLRTANSAPYFWFNEVSENHESFSVLTAVTGRSFAEAQRGTQPFPSRLRDSLQEVVSDYGLDPSETLLYLSQEDLNWLSEKFGQVHSGPWAIGLAITAITGSTLVFGVLDHEATRYGFSDYGPESERVSRSEVSEDVLCSFNRPVIFAESLRELRFSVACTNP